MYDIIQYRFLVSHNVTFCQKSYLTNKTEKGICLMMDTTIIYNDYLSGDAKALERLMEIYGDKLTLYINGYIKNLHDSEDLLIEVFAYLISKRPNIKSSFESYIYKAARNHALMFLRKAKRHIILTEEEMNFCIENTFEDEVCIAERNKRIYDCMEYLPSAQKEALYLVYIEGMSYKEAAAVLRKSAKQIDKLLQLGKKKLRPLLETEGIKSAFND